MKKISYLKDGEGKENSIEFERKLKDLIERLKNHLKRYLTSYLVIGIYMTSKLELNKSTMRRRKELRTRCVKGKIKLQNLKFKNFLSKKKAN
jgi:hypothetical protein